MALLGKIRQQFGWLMLVLIVLGLGGFLIMDIVGPGRGGAMDPYIGTIDGSKVHFQELEDATSLMANGNNVEMARIEAWKQLVINKIVHGQSSKAGLRVTSKEIGDLFVGENISPIVMNIFGNPQTGQIDRQQVQAQINAFEMGQFGEGATAEDVANIKRQWNAIFKQVHDERLNRKFSTLVSKAIYTPTWSASKQFARMNQSFVLDLVRIPYTAISNNEVAVTDAELLAYMKANAHKYTNQEATVNFEYVLFDVIPSKEDSTLAQEDINRIAEELKNSTTLSQDSSIVTSESGSINLEYTTKNALMLPAEITEEIFANESGKVYGPYFENNAHHVVKVLGFKDLLDSVKFRRIFIPAKELNEMQAAQTTLDSIKSAIIAGTTTFEEAVTNHSQDITSKDKGGDMGFIGADWTFGSNGAANFLLHEAQKDSLYLLNAVEGGIQLVQVTDGKKNGKKGVRLAQFSKAIEASQSTIDEARSQATNFAATYPTYEAFKNGVREKQLAAGTAYDITINDYEVQGLGFNGEVLALVKWAHRQADINQTATQVFELKNDKDEVSKIVLPIVTAKNPAGLASLQNESIRAEVERMVRNEKKAQVVKSAIGSVNSLNDVAQKYNVEVESNKTISFSAPFLNNNLEPKVAAVADILNTNAISAPIAANEGIYLINVTSKTAAPTLPNPASMSKQVSQRTSQAFSNVFVNALTENADVIDNRAKLYN